MKSLHECLPGLTAAIRRQPLSEAKLAFCWQLVAGAAIARATTLTLAPGGEVVIRTQDGHWTREVRGALPELKQRLETLLGPEGVAHLKVEGVRPGSRR
ncbi:MAG: DciA family protein [Vicinamibacterales bacterium]